MAATDSLRREVARLSTAASRDLNTLWREVAEAAAAETALRDVLPAVVEQYGAAAAALAAEWYDDLRTKAGVGGRFSAIPVEPTDRGSQALIGWALTEATDYSSFQTLVIGGTQRRIADHARHTVMDSTAADPKAEGWQRVATSSGCAFCRMLAGRAVLYRSETTADFGAHDGCSCEAQPAFSGEPRPVRPYTPSLRYDDSPAGRAKKAADRARVREYLRTH